MQRDVEWTIKGAKYSVVYEGLDVERTSHAECASL